MTVRILDEVGDLDEFLTNAKAMVKERSYSYNSQRTSYASTAAAAKPAAGTGPYNPLSPMAESQAAPITPIPAPGEKPRTRIGAGWYGKNASQQAIPGFGEEDDDPYATWNVR